MDEKKELLNLLIVDDDEDDCLMIKNALEECNVIIKTQFLHNGEELLNYLHKRGKYSQLSTDSLPCLIFLDLNMPKKDGREALKEIKSNSLFRRIPIVIMTTSKSREDIFQTYDIGVNSFITKPSSYKLLVEYIMAIKKYWLQIVNLPDTN